VLAFDHPGKFLMNPFVAEVVDHDLEGLGGVFVTLACCLDPIYSF